MGQTMKQRPTAMEGVTIRIETGCGRMYVTLNHVAGHLQEIFINMGKSGGCAKSNTEGQGITLSYSLRSGANPFDLAMGLVGIRCQEITQQGPNPHILSCNDAIGKAILYFLGYYDENLMPIEKDATGNPVREVKLVSDMKTKGFDRWGIK